MKDLITFLEKLFCVLQKCESILTINTQNDISKTCNHEPYIQNTRHLEQYRKTKLLINGATGMQDVNEVIVPICVKCGKQISASNWTISPEVQSAT